MKQKNRPVINAELSEMQRQEAERRRSAIVSGHHPETGAWLTTSEFHEFIATIAPLSEEESVRYAMTLQSLDMEDQWEEDFYESATPSRACRKYTDTVPFEPDYDALMEY